MVNHRFENALVLSGGSIKGAFQAGAIAVALEQGFVPDAVYGISVGALNGAFLADRAGRAAIAGKKPDWPKIGAELVEFWRQEIQSENDIVERKGFLGIAAGVLLKNFNGLTHNDPIKKLVEREALVSNIQHSPVYFACGASNLNTGRAHYADYQNAGSALPDFIIASASVPFFMPQVEIQRAYPTGVRTEVFVDGILRDSSPLGFAIDKGATHMLCIYCHPEALDEVPALEHNRLMVYTERVMDIISNEQIKNDHRHGVLINDLIRAGASVQPGMPLAGKRLVKGLKRMIRPEREIPFQPETVTAKGIAAMLEWGKRQAHNYFKEIAQDPAEDPRVHA